MAKRWRGAFGNDIKDKRPDRRLSIDPVVLMTVVTVIIFLGVCWVVGLHVADESVAPWMF